MRISARDSRFAWATALSSAALLVFFPLADAQGQPVNWTHLSSATYDLPLPAVSSGQSGLRVVDLDDNGQNDYVITLWSTIETVVWYRHLGDRFIKHVIDTETPDLSHGEKFKDIDGDGDIDLLFADASTGNKIFWWENPFPDYEPNTPWVRRVIRNSGGGFYHDNIWGDFDGDGSDELIAWNQYDYRLLLFEIPADPRNAGYWPATQIFSWAGSPYLYRGADTADVNLDGKIDFVGGGGWFEHTGGTDFTQHLIDGAMGYSQIKAGQFIPGGRPEIVCVLETEAGPLNLYEWTGSAWQTRTILANVPRSHTLQVGDVDADGHLDIMTGELGHWSAPGSPPDNPDARISVLYGDGTGNFTQQVVAPGQGDLEGQLADIDADGDLDIVAKPFRHNMPRADIWLNQGASTIVQVPDVAGATLAEAEAILAAAGLSAGTLFDEPSAAWPTGQVLIQHPVAEVPVLIGSTVDLMVSLGAAASDYYQDFEDYTVNRNPVDWFDTGADNGMVEEDGFFRVFEFIETKAFGTASRLGDIHSHYLGASFDAPAGLELGGRMMMTDPAGGVGVTFLSQYPVSDAYYRLSCNGTNAFHLTPHGTGVAGDVDTDVLPAPNAWYRFKVQVEDSGGRTEIRAKVWVEDDGEPPGWQIDAYDDSVTRLMSGAVGVWGTSGGSKYWDDLAVVRLTQLPEYSLTVGVDPAGSGGVSLDPAGGIYFEGELVELTALAAGGWVFSGWSGDLIGSANPATISMDADKSVTAAFVPASQYSLTVGVNPEGSGSVSLDPAGGIYDEGEVVELTALAAGGWVFISWSGDLIGSANPATISMNANKAVVAVFTESASFYQQDFEAYPAGVDPLDWFDTGANNSMTEDDSLFKVFDSSGEKVFGTESTLANIHSHYIGASFGASAGFEFGGWMMMTDPAGGVGVTFLSQYPVSDAYYRLRCNGGNAFHLAPHGTVVGGDVDTGVVPAPDVWYRFTVRVDNTGVRTEIRAKMWAEAGDEPLDWQINAHDDSVTRLTTGFIGLWGYSSGSKYWDDLAVVLGNDGPQPFVSSSAEDPTELTPIVVTIDFGATVTGSVFSGVAVTNGSGGNPQALSGDESVWTWDVTPVTDGEVTVQVPADIYQDDATNWNAASNLFSITYYNLSPSEVWVDDDYTDGGDNDGHLWSYDAFDSIQDSIDAVASPATVNVAAGTYLENIAMVSGVRILGAGAGVSILDGGMGGTVVTAGDADSSTELAGFTITNGSATIGGGMYIYNGSPTVRDCSFTGNSAELGGGIYSDSGSPTVSNCLFSGNSADYGGGMYNIESEPALINSVIAGNSAFSDGGGICCFDSSPTIMHCTISQNIADVRGGGIFCTGEASAPLVINSILWADDAPEGPEIWLGRTGFPSILTISHGDVQGGEGAAFVDEGCVLDWGDGMIDGDPLFAGGGDYHLLAGSPCVDAGTDAGVYFDKDGDARPQGVGFDMGADELPGGCFIGAAMQLIP